MNVDDYQSVDKAMEAHYPNLNALVVSQHGQVIHQHYCNGYSENEARHVFSVTKSVVSALVGIAIDHGFLSGVDLPILDFFPWYVPSDPLSPVRDVTIRNLLTMTVPYRYEQEPFEQYFSSINWIQFALDAIGGPDPIGTFTYSPIMGAHILSAILAEATGMSLLEFAKEYLFGPLKMDVPHSIVVHDQQEQEAVMADRNTRGWMVDPQGYNTASWGLFLTPHDMLAVGNLYLRGGDSILSQDWITQSTTIQSTCGQLAYGYLWWLPQDTWCAIGDGGNLICCIPTLDAVVVLCGEYTPDNCDPLQLVFGSILPLLLS